MRSEVKWFFPSAASCPLYSRILSKCFAVFVVVLHSSFIRELPVEFGAAILNYLHWHERLRSLPLVSRRDRDLAVRHPDFELLIWNYHHLEPNPNCTKCTNFCSEN